MIDADVKKWELLQAMANLNARQELLNVLLATTGLDKYIADLIADKIASHECSSHGEER